MLKDLFCAEKFQDMVSIMNEKEQTLDLLTACAASPRFRNIRLLSYVHRLDTDINLQFAAVTYRIAPEVYYLAFRGTDKSITGWKEDFYLSLADPVPAQVEALRYLETAAEKYNGILMTGGHSKGGNLAVYAAASCKELTQNRIYAVYSHDGPGFLSVDLIQEGFRRIRTRIHKTIPQSSVFGMLFDQEAEPKIIHSRDIFVMQHYPFSWEVSGQEFVRRERLTADAQHLEKRFTQWMCQLEPKDKERFIDGLFTILESAGVETFEDLGENLKEKLPVMAQSFESMDTDMKRFMVQSLLLLFLQGRTKEKEEISNPIKRLIKNLSIKENEA